MGLGSKDSVSRDWQFWIDRGGTFIDMVVKRADGSAVAPQGTDKIEMKPGDCFIIEKPGGGFGQSAVPKAAE